ncbi:Mrp/NBP35 family ATP-binding protein [Mangrovibacterium sp.]|uniref:Mrp/NBP35 family ATP-binding protein n=1 Tax=Mangrovibacterium sp. TaxID=1961364 RepID=UPI00356799EC
MNNQNPFEKIKLNGVKQIIVVASGKGGVGKSTVAANLAVALASEGYKTALFDADLYGPSTPILFDIENERPEIVRTAAGERYIPVKKYGVSIMSVGFFVTPKKSMIWRGPAASGVLTQLLSTTEWGETDFLIVDFPPGTGDIQLTTIQKLTLTGALIVTTPQQLALADAEKAADMFCTDKLHVPILGVVENMSYFTPALHPDEKYFVFGAGGGKQLAGTLNVPLLAQLPLICDTEVDSPQTFSISKDPILAEKFRELATTIQQKVSDKAWGFRYVKQN